MQDKIEKHAKERAFYDMSGADNIFKYITTGRKILGEESKKFTMLEYLQKSTGVFNGEGTIDKEEVKAMKERLKENKGNLWHGFISFDKEHSEQIDDPEKCIALIKQTFGQFFKDAGFNLANMDLMCNLAFGSPRTFTYSLCFLGENGGRKEQTGGRILLPQERQNFDARYRQNDRTSERLHHRRRPCKETAKGSGRTNPNKQRI